MRSEFLVGIGIMLFLLVIIPVHAAGVTPALECTDLVGFACTQRSDCKLIGDECFAKDTVTASCGNGTKEFVEECDNGTLNTNTVPTCNYGTCTYCNTTCAIKTVSASIYCGDAICQSAYETKDSCPNDCSLPTIKGWTPSGQGWSIKDGMLHANTGGISINSTPFNVINGKQYTLSVYVSEKTTISVTNGQTILASKIFTGGTLDTYTFTSSMAGQFFLVITPDSADTFIDNVSLIPQTAMVIDTPTSIRAISGCCFDSYCWNGNTCVESKNWTNNATKDPLWHNVFTGRIWTNNHINYSQTEWARGYRCVVNDSGYANWTIAQIKYDWNFEGSGYCARTTDCFVGKIFDYNTTDTLQGCIPHGTFIADTQKNSKDTSLSTQGNRYCYQGNWTTRTHIMALQLLNITMRSSTTPFRLFCDNATIAVNDHTKPQSVNPESVCTLLLRESSKDVMVIAFTTNRVNDYDTIPGKVIEAYAGSALGSSVTPYLKTGNPTSTCIELMGTAYLKCIAYTNSDTDAAVYLYYNNQTKFYILSSIDLDGKLGEIGFFTNVWTSISNFFKKLFGAQNTAPAMNVSLLQLGNYEQFYRLENGSIQVSGVQELKYVEGVNAIQRFTYLNYTGADNAHIDLEFLKTFGTVTQTTVGTSQEIIINGTINSAQWKYLTASLRE